MTDRKFTPPTEFPTEYVTTDGRKAVVVARQNNYHPFVAVVTGADGKDHAGLFNEDGSAAYSGLSPLDLHDLPKRIVTWHNVYHHNIYGACSTRATADGGAGVSRQCVYRIERDEDGGNPTITVEQ